MNEELVKLGLSENEAKVYLAVLGLGPASAAAIANRAQIKRPTTYMVLGHLVKLGLISEVADSKEKKFKAEDPDRLTKLTRKMRRQVIAAELELEKLLPGLKAIQKKIIEAPKVTFYQGLEGIKTIIEEFTSYPDSWHYFGSAEELIKVMSVKGANELTVDAKKFRERVGQPTCYIITDAGYYKIKLFQKSDPKIRQVKILPDIVKLKSAFTIFGHKLAVIGVSDVPFGTVIESKEVVALVKMMFQFIWNNLSEEKIKNKI